VKIDETAPLLKVWISGLKKTESLQAFVKFSYDYRKKNVFISLLIMKEYGDKERYHIKNRDLFNATFNEQFQNRQL